jgi:hypothetical protein
LRVERVGVRDEGCRVNILSSRFYVTIGVRVSIHLQVHVEGVPVRMSCMEASP